jgi:hypothetical protein
MAFSFPKGDHSVVFEGVTLSVRNVAQRKWDAYVGRDFIGTGTSKRHATNILGKALGISDSPKAPKAPKAEKPPWVGHSARGLFVYGLKEVCEILADSRESTDLDGVCRPHKGGFFVDTIAAADFWALLSDEKPGITVTCQEGRHRQEVVIPE